MIAGSWAEGILTFWFGLDEAKWFRGGAELDEQIRERFFDLWTEKRDEPVAALLGDPRTALAAVILFDQFPRNMFRETAEQFATDAKALEIAKAAISRGFDRQLSQKERAFLYMPFQHSEQLADQDLSVALFAKLGDEKKLEYAEKHRDIIARYGRFPHRNAVLGRSATAEESAARKVVPW